MLKTINLPRQARDKHRESTQKSRLAFSHRPQAQHAQGCRGLISMAEQPPLDSDVRKGRRPASPPMPRQQRCCCCSRTTAMEPCTVTSTCDDVEIDMITNEKFNWKKGRQTQTDRILDPCVVRQISLTLEGIRHSRATTHTICPPCKLVRPYSFRSLRCALRAGVCGLT
jgi:hypothetical protein